MLAPTDWRVSLLNFMSTILRDGVKTAGAASRRSASMTSGAAGSPAHQVEVGTAAVKVMDADDASIFREVKNLGSVVVFRGSTNAVTSATGYPVLPGEAFGVPDDGEVWMIAASGTAPVGRARA